ncbi:hypothetical protein NMY22_g17184 [Coprinellus aureogranulatus]|nr:hypothetical protein NMY22_g17184 [Coprinellus aureogranulatus]
MQGPLVTMSNVEVNKGNASPDKKGDKSSIIELKNGKVVCRQKCVSFEKQSETLQEIVKFRELIEERLENSEPALTELPDEYKSLIVKLAHESDKALTTLAKHIRQELLPVQDEEDADRTAKANAMVPLPVVEAAITATMDRNNYGIDAPLGVKLPASLSVWRWEAKEQFWECLPKNGREKAESRLEERKAAKKALNIAFEQLPQAEKDVLLKTKGSKLPVKDANADTRTPEPTDKTEAAAVESAKKQGKKKATGDAAIDENGTTPKAAAKQPKPVDPERAAKEKERLEKKAAKEEKERKALDAQKKSRSLMANFFSKPKVTIGPSRPKAQSPSAAGPSTSQSDFERIFKPFRPKKDSVVAPINWFKESRKAKRANGSNDRDIIVIDDDETASDVTMSEPQPSEEELSRMSEKERLNNILSTLPPPADPSRLTHRRKLPSGYRTYHPYPVRDVMNQLSEAEVAGDDTVVRALLSKLQDRTQYPAKVLIFREDARPGYYDLLVFDYGYDSGEEWEEEPVGEDVAEDDEEEDETEADADSDADSWLVDDDEDVDVNLNDLDSITPPDLFDSAPPLLPPVTKRKADDGEKKHGSKKRKVVVPLVPFAKGPCWEEKIGECPYEPFNSYRIQLFNDTPFPIDPFTYVSTCIEDQRASLKASTATSSTTTASSSSTTNDGFVIPSVPARLTSTTTTASSSPSSLPLNLPPSTSHPSLPLPTASTSTSGGIPGTSFIPFTTHHEEGVLKIAELETGSFVLLVETVYEALTISLLALRIAAICGTLFRGVSVNPQSPSAIIQDGADRDDNEDPMQGE